MRRQLAWVAAGSLVPLTIFSALAVGMLLDAERAAARRGVREATRAVTLGVEREFATAETRLRVLAASPALITSDLQDFYDVARRALTDEASWTIVSDVDGRQLLNTRIPFGAPLRPRTDIVGLKRLLGDDRPTLSDLYIGAMTQRPVVTVDLPATARDNQRVVLSQSFDPSYFERVLKRAALPPDWVVAVTDRQGTIVTRQPNAAEYVGRKVSPHLREAIAQATDGGGELRTVTLDGIDVYTTFLRSESTGWWVAVGVPAHRVEAPAVRAVMVALAGLALALAASALFTLALGRRLSIAVDHAVSAAQALGRGDDPMQRATGIGDVDRLQKAIVDAHRLLTHERAAREAAEAEREKLLHREQDARAVAESQNRAKDEFLAMLGHELRNPLSAITAASALLTAARGDPQAVQSASDVIGRQSRQLTHIVNDLLDVSRVMSGKVVLSLAPLDLSAEAAHSLATLRASGHAASRHHITIEASPTWVRGDFVRIDQVITNLLVNAMKYTPDGGQIGVTVAPEGDDAVLRVRDSGVGIEADLLPRLFEVFVQGTPTLARSQGGLGVGLALVKRLVQLHGGTVMAESDGPGRGSLFTVRLPRIEPPTIAHGSPSDRAPAASTTRRVLVIDDHVDAREATAAVLALSGIDVMTASDGTAGLRSASDGGFDAAVVDIGLPDLDGYEVARRLRAQEATRGMALVALTGYGSDADRKRAFEAGFDRHLTKPAQPQELINAIETACRAERAIGGVG